MSSTPLPTRHPTQQSAELERKILDGIDDLRRENQACTMRGLANSLRLAESFCRNTLHAMRKRNLVVWTPMPGSLRTLRSATASTLADVDGTAPAPTLSKDEGGAVTMVWPEACGPATMVTREALAQMVDAHNVDLERLVEARRETERVTAQLVESKTEALTYRGLLSNGQLAALVRTKREPTEKEKAARAEFARKGAERLAARAKSTVVAAAPDREGESAGAEPEDESVAAS